MSSDYGHLAQVRDRAMTKPHHPQKLVNVRLDCLDAVLKHYVAMAGEHAVLAGLLRESLRALEYHREQTRPIERNDQTITKMRRALGLCEKCGLTPGCPDCRAVHDVPEGA
jgi:hypothetical protein